MSAPNVIYSKDNTSQRYFNVVALFSIILLYICVCVFFFVWTLVSADFVCLGVLWR